VWEGQEAGYTYQQPDALLAATALEFGPGIVTRNTEDFDPAGIRLLNPWA
jgi:predicted nucleic acid-binding protein